MRKLLYTIILLCIPAALSVSMYAQTAGGGNYSRLRKNDRRRHR